MALLDFVIFSKLLMKPILTSYNEYDDFSGL